METTDTLTAEERQTRNAAVAATHFRRTRNGDWVICGPADYMTTGIVAATKKSGEITTVWVAGLGKTFDTDGGRFRYGYLER